MRTTKLAHGTRNEDLEIKRVLSTSPSPSLSSPHPHFTSAPSPSLHICTLTLTSYSRPALLESPCASFVVRIFRDPGNQKLSKSHIHCPISSSNRMMLPFTFRPIRFFHYVPLHQPDIFMLGLQPIMCFDIPLSSNQIFFMLGL
jgi:hypothetical protein